MLGLSSKRTSKITINQEEISRYFSSLFSDAPEILPDNNWTIIEDQGTIFGFIGSEEKYGPMCKICNYSVYISFR